MRGLTASNRDWAQAQNNADMGRYLTVSHLIEEEDHLAAACRRLPFDDPKPEFVLIVPTVAPALALLLEPRRSTSRFAARRAQRARDRLLQAGINVIATRLGNSDPLRAVEDATRFSRYSAVVVAAPQHPVLRLLHRDLPRSVGRRFPDLAVIDAAEDRHPGVQTQNAS